MQVSIFLPPAAASEPVPVLYFLSGLTCTEENVTAKAGVQRTAAEAGLAFVAPDTSPRGLDLPVRTNRFVDTLSMGRTCFVELSRERSRNMEGLRRLVARRTIDPPS